jgi:predicted metal-dependent peptidase
VINSHGKRAGKKMSNLANQAMDIVVNESLIKYFKFNRKEIDPKTEYYWMDNSFDGDPNILPWNNFEYYYNRLLKDAKFVKNKQLINDHSGLGDFPEQSVQEIINNLSEEDAESLKNITEDAEKNARKNDDKNIGNVRGGLVQKIENKPVQYKKKWESIIRRFEKKMSKDEGLESHWVMKDRRLYNLNFNIFLPSDIEQTLRKTESEKVATWFFMDTSGSCWSLAPRFFHAAKSLDPKKFDVKYFAFDTMVYEVDLKKQKLDGGGGTSFRCITDFIYNKHQTKPFVWILTDGWGNGAQIPEDQRKKWNWFLTDDSTIAYIPHGCKVHELKNFE